jgi:DNA-binding response OmpR family regulator
MQKGKKILVVSHNTHFMNTIGLRLSRYNYQVQVTRARDEALLQTMNDIGPDLTILDAPLISIDGIRQLLNIRDSFDVPILMLSTQGAKADTVQTLSLGTYSHPMIKPMTFEQLTGQINQLLDKQGG